jgi:hypothetical protein
MGKNTNKRWGKIKMLLAMMKEKGEKLGKKKTGRVLNVLLLSQSDY